MQRIYTDTSVFGGYYDDEFSEHTIPFFEKLAANEFVLLYSSVTEDELGNAPENVKELVNNIKKLNTEFLEISEEAIDLATDYITEKVVGKTSFADCLHIAIATINHADFLVSWNFKHIVNVQRIRGYNSINIKKVINNLKYEHQENSKIMKTTDKKFDAVKFMRQQRDKLSGKLSKMTKKEILEYFKHSGKEVVRPNA